MKRIALSLLCVLLLGIPSGFYAWVKANGGSFWFNRQWAGFTLTDGGYRSWSLRFCDGEAIIDGKQRPVCICSGQVRVGYHLPQYRHVDMRKLFGGLRAGTWYYVDHTSKARMTNVLIRADSPR